MTNHEQDPQDRKAAGQRAGAEEARRTFARRRARRHADELALIDPSLWDAATRAIVMTLATLCIPSRIDKVLDNAIPAAAWPAAAEAARAAGPDPTWARLRCRNHHTHATAELADACGGSRPSSSVENPHDMPAPNDARCAHGHTHAAAHLADDCSAQPGHHCSRGHVHGAPELADACDRLPSVEVSSAQGLRHCRWGAQHSNPEMAELCNGLDEQPHTLPSVKVSSARGRRPACPHGYEAEQYCEDCTPPSVTP